MSEPVPVPFCKSADLADSGDAVQFEVLYGGHSCRAFAIRFDGQVHAYLNRCAHIPMEMDYQENRFFDHTGRWLVCATHGATYHPATGECAGGPCRGGLVKVEVTERDNVVRWHTAYNLHPVEF